MASSSNNNTYGIGVGNYRSSAAKSISTSISRRNFIVGQRNSPKVKELHDAVYRMVSGWLTEDKIRIIEEYGDAGNLPKKITEDSINEVCTETLIVHLPQDDVERLLYDIKIDEDNLNNGISDAIKSARDSRESAVTSWTRIAIRQASNERNKNNSMFEDMNKLSDGHSNAAMMRGIRSLDRSFRLPAPFRRELRPLRRELRYVLENCFTNVELSRIAFKMDIEIYAGRNKYVINDIIDKTILYVSLILGRSRREMFLAGSIRDTAPYDELLSYTSYAWVTGKPGNSDEDFIQKRRLAMEARRQVQIMTRIRRRRAKRDSQEFRDVSGGARSVDEIASNDTGILRDMSYDDLLMLAGKFGVRVKKRQTIAQLKFELYRAIADNQREINRIQGSRRYNRSSGNRRLELDSEINVRSALNKIDENSSQNGDSSNLPIVTFDKSGKRIELEIPKAVPVYIVGSKDAYDRDVAIPKSRKYANIKDIEEDFGGKAEGISKRHGDIELSDKEYNWLIHRMHDFEYDPAHPAIAFSNMREFMIERYQVSNESLEYFSSVSENAITKSDPTRDRRVLTEGLVTIAHLEGMRNVVRYLEARYGVHPRRIKRSILRRIVYPIRRLFHNFMRNADRNFRRRHGSVDWDTLDISDKDFYNALYRSTTDEIFADLAERNHFQTDNTYVAGSRDVDRIGCSREAVREYLERMEPTVEPRINDEMMKFLAIYVNAHYTNHRTVADFIIYTKLGRDAELMRVFRDILKKLNRGKGLSSILGYVLRAFRRTNSAMTKAGTGRYDDHLEEETQMGPNSADLNDPAAIMNTGFHKTATGVPIVTIQNNSSLLEGANIEEAVPVWIVGGQQLHDVKKKDTDDNAITSTPFPNNILTPEEPEYDDVHPVNGSVVLRKSKSPSIYDSDIIDTSFAEHLPAVLSGANIAETVSTGFYNSSSSTTNNPFYDIFRPIMSKFEGHDPNTTMSELNPGKHLKLHRRTLKSVRDTRIADNKAAAAAKKLSTPEYQAKLRDLKNNPENLTEAEIKELEELKRQKKSGVLLNAGNNNIRAYVNSVAQEYKMHYIDKEKEKSKVMVTPAYIVNKEIDELSNITSSLDQIYNTLTSLSTGLSAEVVTAPYGVGAISRPLLGTTSTIAQVMNEIGTAAKSAFNIASSLSGSAFKVNTGAHSITRMVTGGTAAITGDAVGSDIFANGAKPELVQSTGSMKVTPLNEGGSKTEQKINRMSLSERSSALATSIASHVVKLSSLSLPDGASEVSNPGEAIKVYDVKPGISDSIDLGNGNTTSVISMLGNIYTQLASVAAIMQTSGQVLNAIAANTSVQGPSSQSGSSNPFVGSFPTSMDSILAGE